MWSPPRADRSRAKNARVAQAVTLVDGRAIPKEPRRTGRIGRLHRLEGDVVSIGDFTVGRIVQQPGFGWPRGALLRAVEAVAGVPESGDDEAAFVQAPV